MLLGFVTDITCGTAEPIPQPPPSALRVPPDLYSRRNPIPSSVSSQRFDSIQLEAPPPDPTREHCPLVGD